MTLAKAVEDATKRSNYPWSDGGQYTAQDYKNEGAIELANHLLASLPEPMTEEEISVMIISAWHDFGRTSTNGDASKSVIKALKSAGVLLVKEEMK